MLADDCIHILLFLKIKMFPKKTFIIITTTDRLYLRVKDEIEKYTNSQELYQK